jgi:hypothetical protein
MILGFVLHFVPKEMEDKVKDLLAKLPLVAYLIIAFVMIFIFMQVKTAEPVLPIYLQF